MTQGKVQPNGREVFFQPEEIIVTKTDLNGRITYANSTFLKVSGFSEQDLVGRPHSIVRHPDMPRCVFKLLWETIMGGSEVFAYVVNMCKDGGHYWVLAHVTPSFDEHGAIVGYHSNRRAPNRNAINRLTPIYRELCGEETKHGDPRKGLEASYKALHSMIAKENIEYGNWIFNLNAL